MPLFAMADETVVELFETGFAGVFHLFHAIDRSAVFRFVYPEFDGFQDPLVDRRVVLSQGVDDLGLVFDELFVQLEPFPETAFVLGLDGRFDASDEGVVA